MTTIITFGHGNPWDKEREWPVSAIEQMAVLEELNPQQTADLRADHPDFDFDRSVAINKTLRAQGIILIAVVVGGVEIENGIYRGSAIEALSDPLTADDQAFLNTLTA